MNNQSNTEIAYKKYPLKSIIIITSIIVILVICGNNTYALAQEELNVVSIDNVIIENTSEKFYDIKGHWAENNIQSLIQKGAISGYPDGSFQPEKTISRAEFVTVLVKALNISLQTGNIFADTQGHWGKDYINTAYNNGIVKGITETQFGPDAEISREQMATMIINALKLPSTNDTLKLTDQNTISVWALQAVKTAMENQVMSGYPDNTFRPQNNATRAEAATVIMNVCNNTTTVVASDQSVISGMKTSVSLKKTALMAQQGLFTFVVSVTEGTNKLEATQYRLGFADGQGKPQKTDLTALPDTAGLTVYLVGGNGNIDVFLFNASDTMVGKYTILFSDGFDSEMKVSENNRI